MSFMPLVLAIVCFAPAAAQDPQEEEDPEDLQPRLEVITTKDGVPLRCGYFPSDRGKEAVPVILLHEWKGLGPPLRPLAEALQKAGCAVLTPDLRGHGGSRSYRDARGQTGEFDLSRMGRRDVQAMLSRDLEALKGFVKDENDAEQVNLNALTLIGFGEGGILAANYAVIDWNFPDIGSRKQSRDVRALVLVSPARALHGFTYEAAIRHPAVSRLPWLIIAGEQSPQATEAERLHRQVERLRRGGRSLGPVQLELLPTSFSNARLVRDYSETVPQIEAFVKVNVIDRQEHFPWESREK